MVSRFAGIVFTAADVARLEKTFLTRVLLDATIIAQDLGHTGKANTHPRAPFQWARLARSSPQVRERILDFVHLKADAPPDAATLLGMAHLVASLP